MQVGDLVQCWRAPGRARRPRWGPWPGTVMIGILMDVRDAPDDVMVYLFSEKCTNWFNSDEYEVISESR